MTDWVFYNDEGALTRCERDRGGYQLWRSPQNLWTRFGDVDLDASEIPREQAAKMAGGEANLDKPVYERPPPMPPTIEEDNASGSQA